MKRVNISVISVYAPQYALDDSQKKDFYDGVNNVWYKVLFVREKPKEDFKRHKSEEVYHST